MKFMKPILVVDPDEGFLRSLQAGTNAPMLVAKTGAEAQKIMAGSDPVISAIFVNPRIAAPYGLSVLRFAHLKRAGTPLFLIQEDEQSPFDEQQKRALAIQDSIRKPVKGSELAALVSPILENFDADAALRQARANLDPVGTELAREDQEFVPILAQNFLSGRQSYFDIYIRIRKGSYVKLLLAGDTFPAERLFHYVNKGVAHFYLRKEAQASYLTYCDHLTSALLRKAQVPSHIRTSQTLNLGQETASFLRRHGVNETGMTYANRFVQATHELISRSKPAPLPEIQHFLHDLKAYEHGVATVMIASLLIRTMGCDSGRLARIVGVAALLHDIGLQGLVPPELGEDELKMTEAQAQAYRLHPQRGAEILSKFGGIDSGIIQGVSQHHERRNGQGFLGSPRSTGLYRVAELVGISDELVQLIYREAEDPKVNPLAVMERHVFDGFSFPVIDAFRRTFMPQDQTSL